MRLFLLALLSSIVSLQAQIKLTEFVNVSSIAFSNGLSDGTSLKNGLILDGKQAEILSLDRNHKIIFEDAHQSGYHRPHWKYHVWIESNQGFPLLRQNRVLYAVIFYDGLGEVKLLLDNESKLHVIAGKNVKDILYPWAKGTLGRGNPYHEILGTEIDDDGIKYFDYRGFVAYPGNHFADPDLSVEIENEDEGEDS